MDSQWRWETSATLCCVLLLPLWVWITGLNSNAFWVVVLCGLLGFGIGFGLSGLRRGSLISRRVSAVCLVVLLIVAIGYTAISLAQDRRFAAPRRSSPQRGGR